MRLLEDAKKVQHQHGSITLIRRAIDRVYRTLSYKANEIRFTTIGRPVIPMNTPAGKIQFEVDKEWSRLGEIASGVTYEPFLLRSLSKSLDEDSIFYNVGARWGSISRFALCHGVPPNQIHNFEANQERFTILERNLEPEMYTKNIFVAEKYDQNHITLDKYAENHDHPTVIKIDVEGAEIPVLRGATGLIEEEMPELFIEIHPEYKHPVDDGKSKVIRLLQEAGYNVSVAMDHRSDMGEWVAPETVEMDTDGNYLIYAQ